MEILSIWSYVWDVIDEGVDSVISTLKNEIGLNTLSVATSYHSVDHLRVHQRENNFYSSQAAIYFQPDRSLYTNTRIEPPVSPLAETVNPLRLISDGCDRHGMKLSSWTVCLHNSQIGRNQPEVAQRDVFGNPCWHALCPANEDVREYMCALVKDLTTNYNFATVELESCDYQGGRHYHGHEKIGIPLGEMDRFLLGLCFCESCRKRGRAAGIDIAALANGVGCELAVSFASGEPIQIGFDELCANVPETRAYLDMRESVVSSLIAEIKAVSKAPISSMAMGTRRHAGYNAEQIREIVDWYEILCYTPSPESLEQSVQNAATLMNGQVDKVWVGVCAYPPASPDAATLAANVKAAADLGVRAVSFYNYGIMPMPNLKWVKTAIEGI
ncbi:MAG: hypothetical protein O7E52_26200 [Candidatus Poribacteria bacterium]|nr:hypothetical protein [Candidatus Poribacteria bacterium]